MSKKIEQSGPVGPFIIHRIRSESREKDLPTGKFCTGESPHINEHASFVEGDITCKNCLKIMSDLKLEKTLDKSEKYIQPIVIHAEHSANGHRSYAPLVFGQDHEPTLRKPLPAIWIAFGEHAWYCGFTGTKELRDLCNAVLKE